MQVCRVDPLEQLPQVLQRWGFGLRPWPTLVVVGGASGLDDDSQAQVDTLFTAVLAPLAETLGLCVIDGGTDAGVMRLMGQARTAIGGTFPLVGVAPAGLVNLPGCPCGDAASCGLEPNHTHCLLVPGNQWGDESVPLAQVATYCAQGAPTVTVLINGGSVTWRDALASVEEGRRVVAIADSGRAADAIVEALKGAPDPDSRAQPLLASGLLATLDLGMPPPVLTQALTEFLTP